MVYSVPCLNRPSPAYEIASHVLVAFAVVILLFSYKSLTKTEPITRDVLSKLEPGKRYEFELKSGLIRTIFLMAVDGETIKVYTYHKMAKSEFQVTYGNAERHVVKVSVIKFNPSLTIVAAVISNLVYRIPLYSFGWQQRRNLRNMKMLFNNLL